MTSSESTAFVHYRADIAEQLDVTAAVLFNFLLRKINNSKNHRAGQLWWYGSVSKEIQPRFPYLSKFQIRRALDLLEEEKYILRDSFNARPGDRTSWYTIPNHTSTSSAEFLRRFTALDATRFSDIPPAAVLYHLCHENAALRHTEASVSPLAINIEQLSRYFGLSASTVRRSLKLLESEKIIRRSGSSVELLDDVETRIAAVQGFVKAKEMPIISAAKERTAFIGFKSFDDLLRRNEETLRDYDDLQKETLLYGAVGLSQKIISSLPETFILRAASAVNIDHITEMVQGIRALEMNSLDDPLAAEILVRCFADGLPCKRSSILDIRTYRAPFVHRLAEFRRYRSVVQRYEEGVSKFDPAVAAQANGENLSPSRARHILRSLLIQRTETGILKFSPEFIGSAVSIVRAYFTWSDHDLAVAEAFFKANPSFSPMHLVSIMEQALQEGNRLRPTAPAA